MMTDLLLQLLINHVAAYLPSPLFTLLYVFSKQLVIFVGKEDPARSIAQPSFLVWDQSCCCWSGGRGGFWYLGLAGLTKCR